MRKLYQGVMILGMMGQCGLLCADELSERKAQLERQIAELKAKEKERQEVEKLERRIQELQSQTKQEPSAQDSTSQQTTQQFQKTYQSPQRNPYLPNVVTQEMRDAEAKEMFGKNRNGILLGLGIGSMKMEYLSGTTGFNEDFTMGSARFGYQRFPFNKAFGLRLYVDSFVGNGRFKDGGVVTQIFTAYNADILMDLNIPNTYHYIGLFVGAGVGTLQFSYVPTSIWESKTELAGKSGFINFGAAITLDVKHRLECYIKQPALNKYDDKFYWQTSMLLNMTYQYAF